MATANFVRAMASAEKQPVLLAKIELVSPSARTIRIASGEVILPDGTSWEAMIAAAEPIRAGGDPYSTGPNLASSAISLFNKKLGYQASGTLLDSMAEYIWDVAEITLYHWERSLTDVADLHTALDRAVINRIAVGDLTTTLFILQSRSSLDRPVPRTTINGVDHPNAPNNTDAIMIAAVGGDHRAIRMRSPFSTQYGNKDDHEDSGAGQGVVPGIILDTGAGAGDVEVVFAEHDVMELSDRTNGYTQFLDGGDVLAPIETAGLTEDIAADKSSILIDDDNLIAKVGVAPIDVRVSQNTALNPRKAMVLDETVGASLDQNTSNGVLELILPSAPNLGRIESVEVVIAFVGHASNGAVSLRARPYNPDTAAAGTAVTDSVVTLSTARVLRGTWDAAFYNANAWDFGGDGSAGSAGKVDIRIDFTGGTTNRATILWAMLVPKYRPSQSLLVPARATVVPNLDRIDRTTGRIGFGFVTARDRLPRVIGTPAKHEFTTPFFANIKGKPDDGSGSRTGSAGALIQRPPDLARWFMEDYGGIDPGDIETGVGAVGSFVDARTALRDAAAQDYVLAPHVSQRGTLQDVLQQLVAQSLSQIHLDRFDSKWRWITWKKGAFANYGRKIRKDELLGLRVERGSDVDVRQGIRVRYCHDGRKGRTLFESFVGLYGSSQGFTHPTQADQRLTVDATNEDLDWTASGTTYAAAIAHGTYTPIDLAIEVRSEMRTAEGNASSHVGWGFSVVTGFNDKIDIRRSGVNYPATLTPGDYESPEHLAIEVARALNALGTDVLFTCTYDHATSFFTIAGSATFEMHNAGGANGPNVDTSALYALGFGNSTFNGAATYTAGAERYRDTFWFLHRGGLLKPLFGTGASAATSIAILIGFDRADGAGFAASYQGAYTRGGRELLAETSRDNYGEKREEPLAAPWIRLEAVATVFRNRHFDLRSKPPTLIPFEAYTLHDLKIGHVIEMDAEVDDWKAYPVPGTDGSWAGKTLIVSEVVQHQHLQWHQEVLAVAA